MKEIGEIKSNIYKIAAVTDRGQRLNKLISPMYEEKANEMDELIEALKDFSFEISEKLLSGEWELIFSNVELFRSSPFFLAIEKALNDEFKSNLFFKLHQLQVGSFGISTIGRIAQNIDFDKKEFISTFDTTIFGLTTIPILGWFKLLPTFGGRVITLASDLVLRKELIKLDAKKFIFLCFRYLSNVLSKDIAFILPSLKEIIPFIFFVWKALLIFLINIESLSKILKFISLFS